LSGSFPHNFLPTAPGQEHLKELLYRAIENGRIASTYLFRGNICLGKFAFALDFVRWVKCENPTTCAGECRSCRLITKLDHPDLEVVVPLTTEIEDKPEKIADVMASMAENPFAFQYFDKKPKIGIDAIRGLNERIALSSSSAGGRWTIVRDADMMTLEASNAFLKTLEEPPEDAHIILTSSRPDFLLPTILSRSQSLQFKRLSRSKIAGFAVKMGKSASEADALALSADGSLAPIFKAEDEVAVKAKELAENLWAVMFTESDPRALDLAEEIGKDASLVKAVFDEAVSFFRDHLMAQIGKSELVVNTQTAERIALAAQKFPNSERISRLIDYLNERAQDLMFYPQYDLFIMATVIEGRKILHGEIF